MEPTYGSGGKEMSRCEACGTRLSRSETVQTKVVGKIRQLCGDCGSKIRDLDQEAATTA